MLRWLFRSMNKFSTFAVEVAIIAAVYFWLWPSTTDTPVFHLKSGPVIGFEDKSRVGNLFYSFLGIPYAKAPTGNLRFQPPQSEDTRSKILKAHHYPSPCLQADSLSWKVLGSEDCLFLNVFRPKEIPPRKLLPVIVYVHGGYFMTGGGQNHRPHYFMDEDIILVTFNYRLGALGFLSTLDKVVPGNNGLKDQTFALKWVKENINVFGGDPNKVTLMGESAGASAVHFHMLSPKSRRLFQRAISQSGNAIKAWSLSAQAKEQSVRLGERLNCPTESSEAMTECLMKLDAYTIVETQLESITPLIDPLYMYAPVIDDFSVDPFMPGHPYDLMANEKFLPVPWITGVNSHEGLLVTGRILLNSTLIEQLNSNWKETLPKYLVYPVENTSLTERLIKFYLPEYDQQSQFNFIKSFDSLTDLVSDRLYIYSCKETVLHHSKSSDVYVYFNKYRGDHSFTIFFHFLPHIPITLQFLWKFVYRGAMRFLGQPEYFPGVFHGDELFLMFAPPVMDKGVLSVDYETSKAWVSAWVQFAHGEKVLRVKDHYWKPLPKNVASKPEYMKYNFQSALLEIGRIFGSYGILEILGFALDMNELRSTFLLSDNTHLLQIP